MHGAAILPIFWSKLTDMRIGFVGTGAITKAVVTGLCQSNEPFESIRLSPRNAEVAAELEKLDTRVSVCTDNQHVLDSSDVVCVAVLPRVTGDVLRQLKFRRDHLVISFVAGITVSELSDMIDAPVTLVRAIPLPASAQRNGSTVLYPPNDLAAKIFAAVGAAVEVTDESHFDAFSAATATMSPYYSLLEAQAKWLVSKGIPYDKARAFFSAYYLGLAHLGNESQSSFAELALECTTEGGLNDQMYRQLESEGVFAQIDKGLEAVWARLMAGK
jgi:pyrroline-5-carboxylate reductase